MASPISVTYINDYKSDWSGVRVGDLLWFDFTSRDGRIIRFWTIPKENVMLAHRPWAIEYVEWVVHMVDCAMTYETPERWTVTDCEIDILVEPNMQTYRVID